MRLASLEINNFRGIRHAQVVFPRDSRVMCIIGPGDSGKSSLLKAIEWVLYPTWNLTATDTDFYNCDTESPIVIIVSVMEIPDPLLREDKFGLYLRDLKRTLAGENDDEPREDGDTILTVRLTIDSTLEPKWDVITNRSDPKPITHKERKLLSFGVVGLDHEKDFSWGRNSILQKYANAKDTLHNAYTKAMRDVVANTHLKALDEMIPVLTEVGKRYGVAFQGELHNHLIMQNGTFSTTVGMFDGTVPFSQRGLGSKRLLSIGLHVNAYDDGTVVLVDEIEAGLEPYRITSLLNQFRAQFKENGQLIMTTHSKSVVCECTESELVVANSTDGELALHYFDEMSDINSDIQSMIRTEPDAFLCRRIIVCEGKTEVGFLRALDQYLANNTGVRFAHFGVGLALGGGGDKFFKFAKLFKKCGYDVCVLMDSDIAAEEEGKKEMISLGIPVFSWKEGFAIEEQIFNDIPTGVAESLIQYAIEEKSFEHVKSKLDVHFKLVKAEMPYTFESKGISLKPTITQTELKEIGTIAKNNSWFKRIDKGQVVGDIVFLDWENIKAEAGLKKTICELKNWVFKS